MSDERKRSTKDLFSGEQTKKHTHTQRFNLNKVMQTKKIHTLKDSILKKYELNVKVMQVCHTKTYSVESKRKKTLSKIQF